MWHSRRIVRSSRWFSKRTKGLTVRMLMPDSGLVYKNELKSLIMVKTIHAPVDLIYDSFTNFDKRMEWNEEIKEIILHGKSLNKTGSLHTCLVGPYSPDIESIGRMEDKEKIVYGERLNKFKGLRDIVSIYTFEKYEGQTHVRVEVDYKIKSWFGKMMKPFVRKMLIKQTEDG